MTACRLFSHLLPREFPQPQCSPFLAPVPLLFVAITASSREWWFLLCQQFLPLLSLHIQDVSFRKHEPIPPVWLLFAFIQLQWANCYLLSMLRQIKYRGKQYEHHWHFCVCSSFCPFCFSSYSFYSPYGWQKRVCILKSFKRTYARPLNESEYAALSFQEVRYKEKSFIFLYGRLK